MLRPENLQSPAIGRSDADLAPIDLLASDGKLYLVYVLKGLVVARRNGRNGAIGRAISAEPDRYKRTARSNRIILPLDSVGVTQGRERLARARSWIPRTANGARWCWPPTSGPGRRHPFYARSICQIRIEQGDLKLTIIRRTNTRRTDLWKPPRFLDFLALPCYRRSTSQRREDSGEADARRSCELSRE